MYMLNLVYLNVAVHVMYPCNIRASAFNIFFFAYLFKKRKDQVEGWKLLLY